MTDSTQMIAALDARVERRNSRRDFISSISTAIALGGGLMLTGIQNAAAQTTNPTAPTDVDVLNFALNLEYLEAEFYLYATTGAGLAANLRTGAVGTQGAVTPGHQVPFADPFVAQYAREIAADELAHVTFLRTNIPAASLAAEPAIDVGFGASNAFNTLAQAAGISPGVAFDPYANDDNFLLGAFIFEDVGVTAYKGASPIISNATFLEAAAGILAVEAYHAAIVRTTIYGRGINQVTANAAASINKTEQISNLRDTLDSSGDDDQGVAPVAGTTLLPNQSNIVPLDNNGLAYSRTADNVLNVVYGSAAAASMGLFFPRGVNGNIRFSSAFA